MCGETLYQNISFWELLTITHLFMYSHGDTFRLVIVWHIHLHYLDTVENTLFIFTHAGM